MKQNDPNNVSTDWRRELAKLQTRVNTQENHIIVLETRIALWKLMVERFQRILQKLGIGGFILFLLVLFFDDLAKWLVGTAVFSFSYSTGFGLGQFIIAFIILSVSIISLVAGYWRVK